MDTATPLALTRGQTAHLPSGRATPPPQGWPTSDQNGRLQIGISGRHHIGMPGRLAPEYAERTLAHLAKTTSRWLYRPATSAAPAAPWVGEVVDTSAPPAGYNSVMQPVRTKAGATRQALPCETARRCSASASSSGWRGDADASTVGDCHQAAEAQRARQRAGGR